MGNLNPNLLTKDTQAVLDDAADVLKAYGKSLMTPEAVLLALIRSKGTAAASVLSYFAERRGADLDRLERQVKLAVQSRRDMDGDLKYLASGKQAAMALDIYFRQGADAIEKRLAGCRVGNGSVLSMDVYLGKDRQQRSSHTVGYDEIVSDYFQPAARSVPSVLAADQRLKSFSEIESTLEDTAARSEAERCFNCGICSACDYCRLYCPEMAVVVEKAQRSINMDFCKGCGVCATECPRNAMALEEEIK